MLALSSCPDARDLQRLLLGLVSGEDAELLERHLSMCDRCGTCLPNLPAEDALIEAMRMAAAPPLEAADRTIVEGLAQRVRALAPARTATGATPASGREGIAGLQLLGQLGDYRLCRVLGSGGMGVVFQAEDVRLRRFVALKMMKPTFAVRSTARERFLREARLTAAVRHDHIVTIHQVGEARGVPFLAMELLEGETLEDHLQRQRSDGQPLPLPVPQAVRIGREIAAGLAAAHERGLIHRDVKPANVWLEKESGRVKLLDFGLACAGDDEPRLTETGDIVGTPGYLAPEQARGEPAAPRSDLFSLGCVLYRMVTGRPPFCGISASAVLLAVAADEPPAPHVLNPNVPPVLSTLITRLLSKQPAGRPASARTVLDALAALATTPAQAAGSSRRFGRRSLAAAIGISGLLLLAALVLFRDRDAQPQREAGEEQKMLAPQQVLSPLDSLSPRDIPATSRFDGQPAELVGMLGERGTVARRLTFSPDGGRLLATTEVYNGQRLQATQIHFWDVALRREIQCFEERGRSIFSLTFTPDGRRFLVTSEPGPPILRDAASGERVYELKGAGDCVFCAAFSPDGRTLITGDRDGHARPGSLRWWDAQTGEAKACLRGHTYYVAQVLFCPDGRHAVSGSHGADCTVRLWDLHAGRQLRCYPIGASGLASLAVSADGSHLAAGLGDGRILVWDLASENLSPWRELIGHTAPVVLLRFSSGVLTSVAHDYRILRHDLTTGTVILHRKLADQAGDMTFARDGRHLAIANLNGTLFLFRLPTP